MNFDPASLPSTIDMLHLILAVLAVVFFVLFITKKSSPQASANEVTPEPTPIAEPTPAAEPKPAPVKETPKPAVLKEATPDAALQLLTLLQQDARFIDFIQEDVSNYSDADIGAAARVVHEGSKKTLTTYFDFAAIRNEEEESRITLNEGFNASEVRLTGNVVGEAPFTGTLIHKGWKVTNIKLPKLAEGHDTSIVAPAEVEL